MGWDDFTNALGAAGSSLGSAAGNVGTYIRNKFNSPLRQSAQYGDIEDRGNFDLPGYRQRNRSLSNFADSRGGGQFMEGQSRLADLLMRQAQGQDSIAREQLRQDQGRLQAQQMSTMASANPSNAALASRTAAQNMGNIGAQMAGQSQLAGLAERQAAAQAAGGVLGQGRQQDIAAYLGAQGLATQNAGMQQAGGMNYEQQRTQRYGIDMGVPSGKEAFIGAASSGLGAAGMMGGGGGGGVPAGLPSYLGQAPGILGNPAGSFLNNRDWWSDRNLKENIRPLKPAMDAALTTGYPTGNPRRPGTPADLNPIQSDRFLNTPPQGSAIAATLARVPAYSYEYKPGRGLPPGRRVGPMAQDVEKVLPAAVIDTRMGKMIDYQRLQPSIMASLNMQEKRLASLEAALKKKGR